jgi:hypothetical protein
MKKVITFLVFLCLTFSILISTSVAQATTFKQGFYKATALNLPLNTTRSIQNTSFSDHTIVIILDSNQIIKQVISYI